MQVKIVIGTIAFMLTMIILGFATLREPARLEEFSHAFEGRTIENGAQIFQSNCATCHGVNGRSEDCGVDAEGNPKGCVGLPLYSAALLCGEPSQRMEQTDWEGSKRAFIERTVAAGRTGTLMPAWSEQFGGPFRNDQVQDAAAFILNWESEELCQEPTPTPVTWPESVDEVLASFTGDAANGESLYRSLGCNGCHGDVNTAGSNSVGPWLGEIAEVGATREDGKSAAQYVYESVLDPNAFIAPDCPNGPCSSPSAMPPGFGDRLTQQEMADLLAFLLGDGG